MKTSLLSSLRNALLLAFALSSMPASAQTHSRQTRLNSPSGYWNLEINLTTRDCTTARFYNAHDQLVYEERLPDLCLDLSQNPEASRRTTRQLNAVLGRVLQANPATSSFSGLVAQQLKQRRIQRVYAVR